MSSQVCFKLGFLPSRVSLRKAYTATQNLKPNRVYALSSVFSSCRPISRLETPSPWTSKHTVLRQRLLSTNGHAAPIPSQLPPLVTGTWVDRLPIKIRPYVLLARADKPVGTMLLLWPCSTFRPSYESAALLSVAFIFSLVNHYGFVRNPGANFGSPYLPFSIRPWRIHHERRGLHN